MLSQIQLAEIDGPSNRHAFTAGSSAPQLADATVTLRFRLTSTDPRSLEALRYARRAMLREEGTRGVEEGEPSLEEAVFSADEIVWSAEEGEQGRCRAKLDELVTRANRALADLAATQRS